MSEFPRDESDLERRLQAHYQHHYGQAPDAALIWARVQPKLEQQTTD